MLTPANMFILGIIDARPVNPYEIVARIEYNRYRNVFNLANSSIYASIRSMCRKGLIQFELQHTGDTPAKKVYSITDAGKQELKNSIRFYLINYSSDLSGFSVSLLLMHHFSRDELISFLKMRKADLEASIDEREANYEFTVRTNEDIPCIPNVISALQILSHMKADLETTCQAIEYLQKVEIWPQNTFECDEEYRGRWVCEDMENRKHTPTPWGKPDECT